MQSHFVEACRKTEADDVASLKALLDLYPNYVNDWCSHPSLAFKVMGLTKPLREIPYVREVIGASCATGLLLGYAAEVIGLAEKSNLYARYHLIEVAVTSNATKTGLLLLQRGANITPYAIEYCDKYNPSFYRVFGQYYEFHSTQSNHLTTAQVHYINSGSVSRNDIKRIDRKLIKNKANVNDTTSVRKQTALHRAAIHGLFKQYKTLLHLQADPTLTDYKNKTPPDYLTAEQRKRVNDIEPDYRRLREPAVDIIMASIVSISPYNTNALRVALENIYQLPEIKPLLELSKLALLGHHRKSNRFTDATAEYDSDEECEIESRHKLKIRVDPNNDHVLQLHIMGQDGIGGMNARGLQSERNGIFVGINNTIDTYVGTLIHEICHFVANEVYLNDCNPYSGEKAETEYKKMVAAVQSNKPRMPPEFISMLNSKLYRS